MNVSRGLATCLLMASINDRSSTWSIAARLHPSSREPWSVDREKIIWTIVPLVSIQISMVDGNRNSSFDQFQNSTAVFTLCNRIPIPYQIPRCHAIRPRVPALATSWKFTAGRSVYPDYVLINTSSTVRLGKINTGTLLGVFLQKKLAGPQKRAT